ncbi:hypothetical protein DICSQDRAFT_138592 [Dichomitus squalens LYAD-421 SS1]|uniref:Fungal-type protein kinase domain-containing protein n=1 Tax=Dichomitus squalens (strain LYAD-421) TaxID=732165 RepID=R7STC6_DICSQ|nr:uncharacterized protein DICSQDRAFT_138592 [Dichomitus squalens LYAD-421 SS1]EJF59484.1 hypothetical protein DICSQDRAFT_138592 [Dichomitus squalens LYAD-421 SS1]
MSHGLSTDPAKAVELIDDLEAFFYVLLYYVFRYLTSNCLSAAAWIEGIFDGYRIVDDVYYIGEGKGSAIRTGKLTVITEQLTFQADSIN